MSSAQCREVTPLMKLGFSAIGMMVFIVLSLPWTYQQVNKLFGSGKHIIVTAVGVPTPTGIVIHALVYLIVVFLIMEPWKKSKSCDE